MAQGLHVTWIPSYGPEMRGGKARCTVIISDEEIGSPLVRQPSAAIVLNFPSMKAFEPLVKPGGVLVVNSALVAARSERTDIRVIYAPATDVAIGLGNPRLANAVCLGALARVLEVVPLDALAQALDAHLPARHRHLLGLNREALRKGAAFAEAELADDRTGSPAAGDPTGSPSWTTYTCDESPACKRPVADDHR
jgi:2-oxoglutarate ferredoxin oxidoreductase subunit gamma